MAKSETPFSSRFPPPDKQVSIPVEAVIGGLLVGLPVFVIATLANSPESVAAGITGVVGGAAVSAFFGYLRNTRH